MASGTHVDPGRVFTSLADIVNHGCTPEEMYAAICVAATLIVPGCDHASLMVRGDGTYSTVAASDAVAHMIDQLEQALSAGPCLDAIEMAGPQIEPDLTACRRWPAIADQVVAETPVRGAMGLRLLIDRHKVGALNLFSDTPNGFQKTSIEHAMVLAAFATVAASAVALGIDAAMLRRGLISNRGIGKAIGMLMVLNDVSDDEAFDLLRRSSQGTNVKLADIAADVVRRCSPPDKGA
ncbi:MAG: GAF and ANTAR domain-containing protein [Mycobacterium sp.]|nr:GAF and ANTAR domain-containing protein [Mycobacterium sp.]